MLNLTLTLISFRFYIVSFSAYAHRSLSFLPRRYAIRKRGLCCRPVSVCMSVTFVYCIVSIQTAEDIVKLLSLPGSTTILLI